MNIYHLAFQELVKLVPKVCHGPFTITYFIKRVEGEIDLKPCIDIEICKSMNKDIINFGEYSNFYPDSSSRVRAAELFPQIIKYLDQGLQIRFWNLEKHIDYKDYLVYKVAYFQSFEGYL